MKGTEEKIEDIINYFAISLFGQRTVDEILWDLAKNCISKLEFEDCVIYLLDESRNVLVQKAAYGPKNPSDYTILEPIEIPIGKGIVGAVAASGKFEIVSDTTKDTRYILDDAVRNSEIAVPILLDEKVIGVIDSEHSQKDFFNERHARILTLIASLCANKILLARGEEKIRKEQEALSLAQQKLSEFKLMALRAQMNPHFVFNALNNIQFFITEKETSTALSFLSLFGKFIRKILNISYHTFISLDEEIELLKNYLTLEKMRFESRFDFQIEVSDSLIPSSVEIPVLLIHPFVDRALTEGFLNVQQRGMLNILFDCDGEYLRCRIGRFDQQGKSSEIKPLAGKKITIDEIYGDISERVKLLNTLYQTDIRIHFEETMVEVKMQVRQVGDIAEKE